MKPFRPLVSCLMPTRDRRPFVPQALRQFLDQDYANRELVIVDDGNDPIGDLVPEDPRIRYERRSKKVPLGAKRNLACEMARGEVLVHWDDDDWMASWRLSYQVKELLDAGADVCGLDRLLFYNPRSEEAWRYVYPAAARPWVAGGTLCYTRAFWRRHPFEPVDVGEDNRFVFRARRMRLVRLADERFYVALIHERNTSKKRTVGAYWRAIEVAEVRSLLGKAERSEHVPEQLPPPKERSRTGPRSPSGEGVTVSIPYYRCGATVRRAVESILAQTHEKLTLVVVNDGDDATPPWPLLDDIDDPRLVRFDLERNRGRYFVDAVVLAATSDPYYVIQDADDWSERHRISILLRRLKAEGTAGAVSAIRRIPRGRAEHRGSIEHYRGATRPLTPKLIHRASHTGLFRAAALRAVGGYFGGFRIGYDTFLMSLLLMTDRLAYVDQPLYNSLVRPDSLTKCAATGMGSAARREAHRLLHSMYADAFELYERFRRRELARKELESGIRRICRRHVEPEDAAALDEESARLRERLAGRRPAARPIRLADGALPWSGWTLGRKAASDLRRHLAARRPRRVLEVGSGTSTVLLADYARRSGASLVTLEHDERYLRKTDELLGRFDLRDRVDLKLAQLVPFPCPDGNSYPWYSAELSGPFDFVLIDGPPQRFGRQASLFAVFPHLAGDGEIWLNDAGRAHETACVELWNRHLAFACSLASDDKKGVFRLSSREADTP